MDTGGYIAVLRAAARAGNDLLLRGWGSVLAKFLLDFWLFPVGWMA